MIWKQLGDWKVPLLEEGEDITDNYCKVLQDAIKSDGCTIVSELYHQCCVVHDLGYQFGVDPWGRCIDRSTIDANFRKCIEKRSKLGRFQPDAYLRFLGVRLFGGLFRHMKFNPCQQASKS